MGCLSAGAQPCWSSGEAVHVHGLQLDGLSCRDGEQLGDERVKSNKDLPDAESKCSEGKAKLFIFADTFSVAIFGQMQYSN